MKHDIQMKMFFLLFFSSVVSIRECNYEEKSGLLKDVCIWVSLLEGLFLQRYTQEMLPSV